MGFCHACWGGDAVGKGERNYVKGKDSDKACDRDRIWRVFFQI